METHIFFSVKPVSKANCTHEMDYQAAGWLLLLKLQLNGKYNLNVFLIKMTDTYLDSHFRLMWFIAEAVIVFQLTE